MQAGLAKQADLAEQAALVEQVDPNKQVVSVVQIVLVVGEHQVMSDGPVAWWRNTRLCQMGRLAW